MDGVVRLSWIEWVCPSGHKRRLTIALRYQREQLVSSVSLQCLRHMHKLSREVLVQEEHPRRADRREGCGPAPRWRNRPDLRLGDAEAIIQCIDTLIKK